MRIYKTYKELLDKSLSSMLAAIEIYNKPNFEYRQDTFAILCVNSWELLLKAVYLRCHHYKLSSLYEMAPKKKKNGTNSKVKEPVRNRSGNPKTLSIEKVIELLKPSKMMGYNLLENICDNQERGQERHGQSLCSYETDGVEHRG